MAEAASRDEETGKRINLGFAAKLNRDLASFVTLQLLRRMPFNGSTDAGTPSGGHLSACDSSH